MSMCDCNQGRLPCTCKTIEGAKIMSVKSYTGNYIDENGTVHGDVQLYLSVDFDRVTAERDALQERLNAADQKDDDQAFQLKDREGSRRDWVEEAQMLEKRYCCLANDQLELVKELADRDALLRKCLDGKHTTPGWNQRMKAALSASAGPECQDCKGSRRLQEPGNPEGDCSRCAPVERDERAEIEEALLWLDDFVARCNGDDRGSCSAVETLRAALDIKATEGASHA